MKRTTIHLKRIAGLLAILVLLLGLLPVGAVFAQDETPPPEEAATDEPTGEEEPAEPAAEESAAEPEVEITPEVTLDPMPETAEEETAAEVPAEEEEIVINEEVVEAAVEELAESGTIITNESGAEVSLASEEAAEVLSAPDPMYCPPGEVYGGPTCSPARANMADAIADAAGNGGTIFVEPGTFDGFTLTGFNGEALVIEGSGAGSTYFDSQIYITGNLADVTLRGFSATSGDEGVMTDGTVDPDGSGNTPTILALNNSGALVLELLEVYSENDSAVYVDGHYGDVVLYEVEAESGGDAPAAYVDNTVGVGDVRVDESEFKSKDDDGLKVKSAGPCPRRCGSNPAGTSSSRPLKPWCLLT